MQPPFCICHVLSRVMVVGYKKTSRPITMLSKVCCVTADNGYVCHFTFITNKWINYITLPTLRWFLWSYSDCFHVSCPYSNERRIQAAFPVSLWCLWVWMEWIWRYRTHCGGVSQLTLLSQLIWLLACFSKTVFCICIPPPKDIKNSKWNKCDEKL